MATTFECEGPFNIGVSKEAGGRSLKAAAGELKNFWASNGLGSRVGCYVFGFRRSGGSYMPWYVGKATKSFAQECFQSHKLVKYGIALNKNRKGTPFLLLLCHKKGRGKTNGKAINALELDLINEAFQVNENVTNERKSRKPKYVLRGLNDPGGPSSALKAYKQMMGY